MTGPNGFYVGYRREAPKALARFVRAVVVALGLVGVGVAATLPALQNRFDPGVFEFGVVRSFEGTVREDPYPLLLVDPPVEAGGEPTSRFLLVAFGKHGAVDGVAGLDGRRVRLKGSLIYREGMAMIEIATGTVEPLESGEAFLGDSVALGPQTLRGEIVDSKCFLGVMKPGRGKTHRACAVRCISGGVPPVLRVETAAGDFRHYLLTDRGGGAVNDRVLDLVAEPVEITGDVSRRDSLLLLQADPESYRRIQER